MSLPTFPNVEELLTVLLGELPNGLYATDRADSSDIEKRSYSSSEVRAHAQMIADLYANLEDIFSDKFLTTATESGLSSWERELFAAVQDSSLTTEQRRANLISKLRSTGGISLPAIRNVIAGILSQSGVTFSILPYSGQSNGVTRGAFVLEESFLEVDTWLALEDPILGTGMNPGQTPLDCSNDFAAAGLTEDDVTRIRETAYTYEVQIYGSVDAVTLSILNKRLTELEPARSTHVIRTGVAQPGPSDPATYGWTTSHLNWWVA